MKRAFSRIRARHGIHGLLGYMAAGNKSSGERKRDRKELMPQKSTR